MVTEVDDPVRRLLKRIAAGENNAMGDAGAISPDVARKWLALPEQLRQARDAMRWRKAPRELHDGTYAFSLGSSGSVETVMVEGGSVFYTDWRGGWDLFNDLPDTARFLGPLPEAPK